MTFPMAEKTLSQLIKPKSKSRKRPLKKKKEKGTLMTFPMAKKTPPQLTFIFQAEIKVQKTSPKEKKRKKNINDIPNGKKKNTPAYLHSPSRNPSPGSVP